MHSRHTSSPCRSPATLARRVLARVAPLADQLVTTIQQSNPGYRTTQVVPSEDLWRSCHDNLTRILQLVGGTEAHHGQEYDAARATGQRRAEQGLPIDDLLRSFRMGGRLVWEALVAEARDQGIDDDGLLDVGTRVWEVVDRTSSQVAPAYHDAERLAVRADEQRRTSIWEGLLSGVAEDPGFAFEAARMLEVPVDGRYVVVVAEPASRDTGTVRRLRDRLAAVRVVSTWQVRGAALVGLVLVAAETPDREVDALRTVLEVRGGVSSPVDGLARVPVGFRQALLALRTLGPSDRWPASTSGSPRRCCSSRPSWPSSWSGPGSARCSTCPSPSADRSWRRCTPGWRRPGRPAAPPSTCTATATRC